MDDEEPRWTLVGSEVDADAEMLPVGPFDDDRLPSAFTARLEQGEDPLAITLRCRYRQGERVFVEAVTLEAVNGRSIAPLDLTTMQLAQAVERVTEAAVDPGHCVHVDRRAGAKPEGEELRLIAAVYAFRSIAWGAPRRAVMRTWDLSSATATRWIKRAREAYPTMAEPRPVIPDEAEIDVIEDPGVSRGQRGSTA